MTPSIIFSLLSRNIVHCSRDFKGVAFTLRLRSEPLEDHLVGVARGALALLCRAHGPCEKRAAEQTARNPRRGRGQFVDPIGDEIGPRAKEMSQMRHFAALCI